MDFPFADPPGIVRATQKDEFVQQDLVRKIIDVLQPLKGVRFTHRHAASIQALGASLYLGLTTLAGSRTLGEEYTDIFYLTPNRDLPPRWRLAAYVISSGLAPLVVPKLAAKLRELRSNDDEDDDSDNLLADLLSPASWVAVNLCIFYLTGTYYQISKRVLGLRYAFAHRVDPLTQPPGNYGLISMLMILRGLFRFALYIRKKMPSESTQPAENAWDGEDVTEMGPSLEDEKVLPFIKSESRQCNLCLEPMRAPTVTLCGHLYCWSCIAGWCRQHKECPLCRQECYEQHLLELRTSYERKDR